MKPLGFLSDVTYSAVRGVAGFLISLHGVQKLFGALGAEQGG